MSAEVMSGGGGASLQSKSVLPASLPYTATPDGGYDGFSSLTVQKDGNLVADNIVAGKTIYGVAGAAAEKNWNWLSNRVDISTDTQSVIIPGFDFSKYNSNRILTIELTWGSNITGDTSGGQQYFKYCKNVYTYYLFSFNETQHALLNVPTMALDGSVFLPNVALDLDVANGSVAVDILTSGVYFKGSGYVELALGGY